MVQCEEVNLGDDLEFVEFFPFHLDEERVEVLVDWVQRVHDVAVWEGELGQMGFDEGVLCLEDGLDKAEEVEVGVEDA